MSGVGILLNERVRPCGLSPGSRGWLDSSQAGRAAPKSSQGSSLHWADSTRSAFTLWISYLSPNTYQFHRNHCTTQSQQHACRNSVYS
ncbi:unnamed protein product [Arctia plantaginis]|uniref:Uncharacterized protein n=1 Tax=Arctia plantaginis TaxID=874455 RepID=A0A8S0Z120_ARCPL|nr:unnamed protein product [Arctia plantaginis]